MKAALHPKEIKRMVAMVLMAIALVIVAIRVSARNEVREVALDPTIYSLELLWENDSLQCFAFHKGANPRELFFDKINNKWFR